MNKILDRAVWSVCFVIASCIFVNRSDAAPSTLPPSTLPPSTLPPSTLPPSTVASSTVTQVAEPPCTKAYNEEKKLYEMFQARFGAFGGGGDFTPPSCDGQGFFTPVQCNYGGCYCVNKNGGVAKTFNPPKYWLKSEECPGEEEEGNQIKGI